MSKQFRFYMLPEDIQELLEKLRASIGLRVIEDRCLHPRPTDVVSSSPPHNERVGVKWQLMPVDDARLQFKYYDTLNLWIVDDEISETIELSNCGYHDSALTEGRFYFKTDMLFEGEIWRKRSEFLKWADRVFRLAKRNLQYSRDIDAYIGNAAALWHASGGRFGHEFSK